MTIRLFARTVVERQEQPRLTVTDTQSPLPMIQLSSLISLRQEQISQQHS
nr:hypothetical protein WCOTENJF_WCOTENJF_CDS_0042 [uncultured phage]